MKAAHFHPLDQPTRKEILFCLERLGTSDIKHIAHELKMTPAGIRRHLNALMQNHYVQQTIRRQSPGRPAYLYRLTEKALVLLDDSAPCPSASLFSENAQLCGTSIVARLFEQRKVRLLRQYKRILEERKAAAVKDTWTGDEERQKNE
ncbi:ArsR family transcriptional regulator [Paenibacillus lutrae]|uniref:ArsR family transcriptional regulator n=1 Tax=Paenibacillus lutrae TaxID=2078573 RepID=UPI0012F9D2D2